MHHNEGEIDLDETTNIRSPDDIFSFNLSHKPIYLMPT